MRGRRRAAGVVLGAPDAATFLGAVPGGAEVPAGPKGARRWEAAGPAAVVSRWMSATGDDGVALGALAAGRVAAHLPGMRQGGAASLAAALGGTVVGGAVNPALVLADLVLLAYPDGTADGCLVVPLKRTQAVDHASDMGDLMSSSGDPFTTGPWPAPSAMAVGVGTLDDLDRLLVAVARTTGRCDGRRRSVVVTTGVDVGQCPVPASAWFGGAREEGRDDGGEALATAIVRSRGLVGHRWDPGHPWMNRSSQRKAWPLERGIEVAWPGSTALAAATRVADLAVLAAWADGRCRVGRRGPAGDAIPVNAGV